MPFINIKVRDNVNYSVTSIPNRCPYCHRLITPGLVTDNYLGHALEIIFRCPNLECGKAFIGTYYDLNGQAYRFDHCNIGNLIPVHFSSHIEEFSPTVVEIYNEAHAAEQYGLMQICGVGYRKSLDFLIKDYLIKKNPAEEENVKSKFLGDCIKENIPNPHMKIAAERAVWIGNDETHYVRLWEEKNIQDLKSLIEITTRWIEMVEITNSIETDMPNKKRNK